MPTNLQLIVYLVHWFNTLLTVLILPWVLLYKSVTHVTLVSGDRHPVPHSSNIICRVELVYDRKCPSIDELTYPNTIGLGYYTVYYCYY